MSNGKVILTIIGAYMPYYDGSRNRIKQYSETLEDIQQIIDNNDPSPVLLAGDMNAPLPVGKQISRQWYKMHPFHQHSLLLYDFLANNDLYCCNFDFNQNVNYTYFKNGHKSYIDHVFLSNFASGQLQGCHILSSLADNVSDHFPIQSNLNVTLNNQNCPVKTNSPINYPKLDWSNINLRNKYTCSLKHFENMLRVLPIDEIDSHATASKYVDDMCDSLKTVLHKTVETVNKAKASSYKGKYIRRHWWNENCLIARDRQRFWHSLWDSCDRPKEGHVYDSYKLAKKAYRNACRMALNNSSQQALSKLNALHGDRKIKQFWNLIRKNKNSNNNNIDDISINSLINHFRTKFGKNETQDNAFIRNASTEVNHHYQKLKNTVHHNFTITEAMLKKYVNKLRSGCAAGIDGISAEHLKFAVGTKVIKVLCSMLTICIRFGIVPDSFAKGLLIPLLKKSNIDPSLPKNYRPIVISTTFSKLLELIILDHCSGHEFSDLQFGFVSNRGTTMAAALTHDVIDYMNSNGSPVYACSLDAEGAFDGIPHSVLFKKALGIIPDAYWRILVYWYKMLTVQIKWGDALSNSIQISKGTRQGGLSSPFLFNIFYQEMIEELSNTQVGISINDITYNVFCYADDILLCSASVSGLQKLIDKANLYINNHGLRFNPEKTICITFGKSSFINRKWFLEDTCLQETNSITYLGVCLSNNNKTHGEARIKATRRAFFALKSSGVFSKGTNTETVIYMFNSAIRPVLLYGLHSVYQSKKSFEEIEKIQGKLLKAAFHLKSSCKNTPLLNAMKIPRIDSTVKQQEMLLLKTLLVSNSRTGNFYNYLLANHLKKKASSGRSLISRVISTCNSNNMSIVNSLCNNQYIKQYTNPKFSDNDGIADSLRYLATNPDNEARAMMNALLSPF